MAANIRWGVLGAAKIARDQLCPAIHRAAGGSLAAIASRSPKSCEPLQHQYPGLRLHDGYDALLSDPDIDAIYIPLPNDMHVDMTRTALAAGKHVLCEKPIAMAADEIDQLIALRDASGLQVAEAFMVLHHPQWHRLRALLQAGTIGQLRHVSGNFTYNNADQPENIRNSVAHGGGGLRDIGVYPVVTTRFATGAEPDHVTAKIDWRKGIDLTARVMAQFPDFSMDFYCSMRMALRQEMLFHGTDGWIRLAAPFNAPGYGDAVLEVRSNGETRLERFAEADQYQLMVAAFNSAISGGPDYPYPLEFSRGNQAMIDRIIAADPAFPPR